MRVEKKGRYSRIHLEPGEFYSTREAAVISTLLGSCVSACLYDPMLQIIGMNHFLLSNPRYSRDLPLHQSEAGRYGVQAMELLINDMMSKGARRRNLCAKVFGGASILPGQERVGNFSCVGEVNCTFIRTFLHNEGIPIIAENLGGEVGRVIHFSNGDFSVYLRKIGRTRSARLASRDHECWQRAIEMQEKKMPAIDLWE